MKMTDGILRRTLISTVAVLGSTLLLAGCEQEGPAERAGRAIDDSAERAEEQMERTRDETSELRDSMDRSFTEDPDTVRD